MDKRYLAMSQPPKEALKTIGFGNLKGKSDINPQWKIEAMTEQFGLCGEGWYFNSTETQTFPLESGEVLLYMKVELFVKDKETGEWSRPVVGWGGDFLVKKNKNGLVPNDEAYKMCLTDALGNAMKCVGVAGDIYRGLFDGSKYARREVEHTTEVTKYGTQQKPASRPADLVMVDGAGTHIWSNQKQLWQLVDNIESEVLLKMRQSKMYEKAWQGIDEVLAGREKAVDIDFE